MNRKDIERFVDGFREILDFVEENSEEIENIAGIVTGSAGKSVEGTGDEKIELAPENELVSNEKDLVDKQVLEDAVHLVIEEYEEPEEIELEYTRSENRFKNKHLVDLELPDKEVSFNLPLDCKLEEEEVTLNNGVLEVQIPRESDDNESDNE